MPFPSDNTYNCYKLNMACFDDMMLKQYPKRK